MHVARDEQTWLTYDGPGRLLRLFDLFGRQRKVRLWVVGCCRAAWASLSESSRAAVEVAERYAESLTTADERAQAFASAEDELDACRHELAELDNELYARCVEVELYSLVATATLGILGQLAEGKQRRAATTRVVAATQLNLRVAPYSWANDQDRNELTQLLRCVFGNPFRPVSLEPAWLTTTVVALARQIYEARDFGAMPILADALQDTGCDSDDILNHCRNDGLHCRGCWVVDLVLGKE